MDTISWHPLCGHVVIGTPLNQYGHLGIYIAAASFASQAPWPSG